MSNDTPSSNAALSNSAVPATPTTTSASTEAAPPPESPKTETTALAANDKPATDAPAPETPADKPDAAPTEPAKPQAPETYADYVVPDDLQAQIVIQPEMREKYNAWAKTHNMTQEAAQAGIDMVLDMRRQELQRWEELSGENGQWVQQIKADKEFGGDNFAQTIHDADVFFKTFADPDTVELIAAYRLGNHPGFIKLMAKAGRQFKNGALPRGGNVQPAAPQSPITALANAMYPDKA